MVGMRTAIAYPNGLTASWTYDANNQLLQVRNATPTNVISQFDYTYDAAGRRTAIAKSGSAFGDLSGSVDAYTYNARSELISARRTKNGQPIPGFSEDFDYDPIGNRRSSSTYNERGEAQTSTYEANNLNQYTSRTTPGYEAVRGEADPNATVTVNENPTFRLGSYYFGSDLFDNSTAGGLANLETYATLAQTAANGEEAEDLVSAATNQVYLAQSPETFAYDDDGNQTLVTTKTGLWRVTYNGENRPILWENVSTNSPTPNSTTPSLISMSYDHMGRRREKNDQRFSYDAYLQVADNGGNVYTWDCTEPVATRPLAWHRGNSLDFYTHDGNKNVSEVMSTDGIIAAHYEYALFGAVTTQRGESTTANPWRFSSEYAEDDTATVYYNYRHYDPIVGCWLSRDPIEEKGCKSLYLACCNDMLSRVDHLGRNPAALVTLDVLVAGALSAMSFVAIEISQNSTGLESLAGVLNEAISGLEVCLESVRKLAVEAGVAISEVVDELEKLRRQACEELNNVVQQTKKDVGSFHPAKCDCDMNCYELTKRKNAWLAEGVARAQRDVLCWDCGDEGHQQQQADVWQNFGRCFSFWVFKCSWR